MERDGQISFRPPGHSPSDASGLLYIGPDAPDGFLVCTRSPADDVLQVKDWIRQQLGWPRGKVAVGPIRPRVERSSDPSEAERSAAALAIWAAARDPRGTPVETYLVRHRGLALPEAAAGEAIRYHPDCPFKGRRRSPAMVCLVRDILTDAPRAIHRTALALDGRKVLVDGNDRRSLGPIRGGAIKLTPDADVAGCLGVGEGVESTLSLHRLPEFGSSPVWSLLSAGGIERLPVLSGIEALWLAVDHDAAGLAATKACGDRWSAAGVDVYHVTPRVPRTDLNDVYKGRADA